MPSRAKCLGRRRRSLVLESLEPRTVLSASALAGVVVQPMLTLSSLSGQGGDPSGMSPAEIQQAYGFEQLSGGAQNAGAGQTIAIVDAYDDPNIANDLKVFDQQFGLPAPPSFSKVYESSSAPRADAGWSQEISLDVEWAHAMAPQANIVLVEANSASLNDLLAAVNKARNIPSVSVISMSWGSSEFSGETSYDSYFTTPAGHQGITFVASSGDSGSPGLWPALSPNVLAVGGTTLDLSGGNYGSESGWSDSGGGLSRYESEPAFQESAQTTGSRSSPDVAYNANPQTGYSVYDSEGASGWMVVGGTSAGAPQWAAIVAAADQGLAAAGKATLSDAQSQLYQLAPADFHDVSGGSNGYSAGSGYDLVTGLGTPKANLVVAGLVAGDAGSGTGSGGTGSGGSGSGTSPGGSGSGGSGSGGSYGNPYQGRYHNYGGYYYYYSNPWSYDPWSGYFGGYDPFAGFFRYDPWAYSYSYSWFGESGRLAEVAGGGASVGAVPSGAAGEAGSPQTPAASSAAGMAALSAASPLQAISLKTPAAGIAVVDWSALVDAAHNGGSAPTSAPISAEAARDAYFSEEGRDGLLG